jgi:hypothetical protein
MTPEQVIAAVIAAVVLAWPKIVAGVKSIWSSLPSAVVPAMGGSVSYQDAISNLALVRTRLNSTGLLGDEKSPQRAAIDTLTLALVAGSDK